LVANSKEKIESFLYALLCSSGTLVIHSIFVAAGFKEGDGIISPAYTFLPLLPLFCLLELNQYCAILKNSKMVNLYIAGIKKVIDNYRNLL